MKFDFLGYNEQACKKYVTSPFEKNDDENNFQRQNEVTMVRCPPIKEFSVYILPMRKYFDLYYIASNLKYHSTTLFIRRNKRGKLPAQEANIENLPMKPITQNIRRWRFLHPAFTTKYGNIQREKSYQEVEQEMLNSVEGDVRMPSTLTRLDQTNLEEMLQAGGLLKPSLNKWQADDSVIAFSKVKMMKSSKCI